MLFKKEKEKENKKNKTIYLFFDIDGVLNTKTSWHKSYQLYEEKVKLLTEIAKESNAFLIMTSTWKNGWDADIEKCTPQIQELRKIMKKYGKDILDITPDLKGRSRDKEIERFLYFHPCDEYLIIDDDVSLFENKAMVYQINAETGIMENDKKKILKRMNNF